MTLVPLTVKKANSIVLAWHRHNKPTVGGRWALGAMHNGELVGVAIVGRPIARMVEADFTVEVTRVCTTPSAPKNTNSFLYGATRRVWQTMGGKKCLTYTLQSESGSSLRAAGWIPDGAINGEQWGRKNRPRSVQQVSGLPKLRWRTPDPVDV